MPEDLWRIEIVRSGGFAGMSRRVELSSGDLSAAEKAEVERLIGELNAIERAARPGAGTDRFQYDLTIVRGGQERHLTVSESDLTREQRALLKRLMTRPEPD